MATLFFVGVSLRMHSRFERDAYPCLDATQRELVSAFASLIPSFPPDADLNGLYHRGPTKAFGAPTVSPSYTSKHLAAYQGKGPCPVGTSIVERTRKMRFEIHPRTSMLELRHKRIPQPVHLHLHLHTLPSPPLQPRCRPPRPLRILFQRLAMQRMALRSSYFIP